MKDASPADRNDRSAIEKAKKDYEEKLESFAEMLGFDPEEDSLIHKLKKTCDNLNKITASVEITKEQEGRSDSYIKRGIKIIVFHNSNGHNYPLFVPLEFKPNRMTSILRGGDLTDCAFARKGRAFNTLGRQDFLLIPSTHESSASVNRKALDLWKKTTSLMESRDDLLSNDEEVVWDYRFEGSHLEEDPEPERAPEEMPDSIEGDWVENESKREFVVRPRRSGRTVADDVEEMRKREKARLDYDMSSIRLQEPFKWVDPPTRASYTGETTSKK